MRQIKFRVWLDEFNKMFYDVGLMGGELYVNIDGKGYDVVGDCMDFKLMQFTGLYDRKGTPIYEGDIAKSGKRLFVARWNNDIASFVWKPLDGESSYPCFNVGTVKNMEIVGNVFENPELLEGEE